LIWWQSIDGSEKQKRLIMKLEAVVTKAELLTVIDFYVGFTTTKFLNKQGRTSGEVVGAND